jgi:hypothetical protein
MAKIHSLIDEVSVGLRLEMTSLIINRLVEHVPTLVRAADQQVAAKAAKVAAKPAPKSKVASNQETKANNPFKKAVRKKNPAAKTQEDAPVGTTFN